MNGEVIQEEEEEFDMSPDQLEARIISLLDTCTYTVYNDTRRGLFDRDKLIVLTLLTFQILLRGGKVDPLEYEALCKGARSPAPPLITDDLSRWMNEGQWAAVDALAAVPGELASRSYEGSLGGACRMQGTPLSSACAGRTCLTCCGNHRDTSHVAG
jgi:hypothetical protein